MIAIPPTMLGIILMLLLLVSPVTIIVAASLLTQSLLYKRPVARRRRFLLVFVIAPLATIAIGGSVWFIGLSHPWIFEFAWRFALLTIPFALLDGLYRLAAYRFPPVRLHVPKSSRLGVVIIAESLLLLMMTGAFDPWDRHDPQYQDITLGTNYKDPASPRKGYAFSWARLHFVTPRRLGNERAVYVEAIVDLSCSTAGAQRCSVDAPPEHYRAELQTVGIKTTPLSVGSGKFARAYVASVQTNSYTMLYNTRLTKADIGWDQFADTYLSLVAGAWLILPEKSGPQSLLVRLHHLESPQRDRVIAEGLAEVEITSSESTAMIDIAGKVVPILGALYGATIAVLGALRRNRQSESGIVIAT